MMTRLFSSTKAVFSLVVVALSFLALFLGRATWEQVRDLLVVVVPTWLAAHAVSDAAHTIAAPKLVAAQTAQETARSMSPPAGPKTTVTMPTDPKPPTFPVDMGGLVVLLALLACASQTACGGSKLTPADELEIASHGVALERCKAEARATGPDGGIARYEACKTDAGIK